MSFEIPIVINNRNRLTTTKKLVEDLQKLGYTQIIILDNLSSYPPLLEWYDNCPIEVVRLQENMGQLAIYNSDLINRWPVGSWVAYTDSDLELNPETPSLFIGILSQTAEKYGINKAGLALRIDNLPKYSDYALRAIDVELKYWNEEFEKDVYKAQLDTTFGVIKVGQPFQYEAIRIAGCFIAKHVPWYTDWNNMSEEDQYYLDHASPVSTEKRIYDQWKLAKMNAI